MPNRSRPLLLISLILLAGCRTVPSQPEPSQPAVDFQGATAPFEGGRKEVHLVTHTIDASSTELAGPHDVDAYVDVALQRNPEIQAARNRLEAAAYQVAVASSLNDPKLGLTLQPAPIQTAGGQQELAVRADQQVPWRRKLDTRGRVASSQVNVTRGELAAVELSVENEVKQAYYELYFLQKSIEVTETERTLLRDIRAVADTRYRAGGTSQQDLLRADLEISNIDNELIRLQQRLRSTQARLARLLHVSPETDLRARQEIAEQNIPLDLERLQSQAISARPELRAQLAAVQRDRYAAELARLDYLPDLTVGASWIDVAGAGISPVVDGEDAFLIHAGVNLPIFRRRIDSSIRSAEAEAVASARKYDSLRDVTAEEVTDLFAQVRSRQELLELFREDILPKARRTLEVSSTAYNVGEVDFLQLLDNWRQLLRYELSYYRLEASLYQTLAELEQVVGGSDLAEPAELPTPSAEMLETN